MLIVLRFLLGNAILFDYYFNLTFCFIFIFILNVTSLFVGGIFFKL